MKTKLKNTIRINSFEIISRAVNEGIQYGWMRAHKHDDNPNAEFVKDEIEKAVVGELCDVLKFDEE